MGLFNSTPEEHLKQTAERVLGPKLPEMLANFGRAVAGFVVAGAPVVSEEVFKARYRICSACPLWDAKAALHWGRCKICGCVRVKLQMATEKCPKGKWQAIP